MGKEIKDMSNIKLYNFEKAIGEDLLNCVNYYDFIFINRKTIGSTIPILISFCNLVE